MFLIFKNTVIDINFGYTFYQLRKPKQIITIKTTAFMLKLTEPVHEISNNVVCATCKASDQPAHTRSLIRTFASRLNIL